ncbi:MAG: transketolase family protein [Clostridia bacterium]|nr:transketolase family protein [Clostridia bacterium]MDD4572014.1 transketolase family protein [Clostridia bacterium]
MADKQATRDAYGKALVALGEKNKNLVVLDADLSKSTKTADFAKAYPERFINAGIAEANMVGVAGGLAIAGKTVFVSSFAMFASGRAFEQIRNTVAYPKLNVKIAATHAGITVGEDGASHQAIEDIALMRAVPNMTVVVPADGVEATQAVQTLADMKGPAYLRLGRLAVPVIFDENYKFELGKGVIMREGKGVAIFACGMMVAVALEAAEMLKTEGIDAAVINIHTIKPIDVELVSRYAAKCGAVVTAEEHNIIGGLGSAVAEVLSEHCPVPMARVGVMDIFGESGKPADLLVKYGLTAENIALHAKSVIVRK